MNTSTKTLLLACTLIVTLGIPSAYAHTGMKTEKVHLSDNTTEMETVKNEPLESAKQYLQERYVEAESVLQTVDLNDTRLKPYIEAVQHYQEALLEPLPGEAKIPWMFAQSTNVSNTVREQLQYEEALIEQRRDRTSTLYDVIAALQLHANGKGLQFTNAQQQRLNKLVHKIPTHVPPIVLGETCPGENTLGCYYFSDEIELTPLAMAQSDCSVIATIVHETRHWQQHRSGKYVSMSLEEMEEDAREYTRRLVPDSYSCEAPDKEPLEPLFSE